MSLLCCGGNASSPDYVLHPSIGCRIPLTSHLNKEIIRPPSGASKSRGCLRVRNQCWQHNQSHLLGPHPVVGRLQFFGGASRLDPLISSAFHQFGWTDHYPFVFSIVILPHVARGSRTLIRRYVLPLFRGGTTAVAMPQLDSAICKERVPHAHLPTLLRRRDFE